MAENQKEDINGLGNDFSLFSRTAKISQIVFESDGDVRIDGSLKGTIKSKGKVIIGPDGNFEGDIIAGRVDVFGKVNGNLQVSDMTSFFDNAVFDGDLTTGKITIDSDVSFNASCKMLQQADRKKLKESL
ncbi:MAG: polymer-forming cytoskeletal protein [Bacteroidales bacterium]|nr:polymer-forming cytoskeletal protein [Bacteroidales bacterium]